MSVKDKKLYYNRGFLNSDIGTAFFEADIQSYEYSNGKKDCDATLKLADCNRHITLEFHFGDEEMRLKRLNKIDVLIAELKAMRKEIKKFKIKEGKKR